MASFGARSRNKLASVHPSIQDVCNVVIKTFDFTVINGWRGKEVQNEYFSQGLSTKRWPDSRHNTHEINADGTIEKLPSLAIDIAPWHTELLHIRWKNINEFYFLAGRIMQVGEEFGLNIRWGGDWDMDEDLYDQKFMDLGHFELYKVFPI